MKTVKRLSFLILLITTFTSCVSSRTAITSPEAATKNVDTQSDKNSNFIKANEWMVQTFNNAKSVIQFKDKEAGIVKGKYVMKEGIISTSPYAQSIPTFFSVITIRVKDNASRIEIEAPSGMYSQKAMGVEYGFTEETFKTEANRLINEFEIYMKKASTNDSW
jgi:hypothetical protein